MAKRRYGQHSQRAKRQRSNVPWSLYPDQMRGMRLGVIAILMVLRAANKNAMAAVRGVWATMSNSDVKPLERRREQAHSCLRAVAGSGVRAACSLLVPRIWPSVAYASLGLDEALPTARTGMGAGW